MVTQEDIAALRIDVLEAQLAYNEAQFKLNQATGQLQLNALTAAKAAADALKANEPVI
jgi:hypothetical protein